MMYALGVLTGLTITVVILLIEYTYEPMLKLKIERKIRKLRKVKVYKPKSRSEIQKDNLLNELESD